MITEYVEVKFCFETILSYHANKWVMKRISPWGISSGLIREVFWPSNLQKLKDLSPTNQLLSSFAPSCGRWSIDETWSALLVMKAGIYVLRLYLTYFGLVWGEPGYDLLYIPRCRHVSSLPPRIRDEAPPASVRPLPLPEDRESIKEGKNEEPRFPLGGGGHTDERETFRVDGQRSRQPTK